MIIWVAGPEGDIPLTGSEVENLYTENLFLKLRVAALETELTLYKPTQSITIGGTWPNYGVWIRKTYE